MPRSFFNVPSAPSTGNVLRQPQGLQEFDKLISQGAGSGRASGLSQLMQLMRLQSMIERQVKGSTRKEREAYDAAQRLGAAQNAVFNDAIYQQGYADIRNMSAQKATDALANLKKNVIDRYAQEFNADPKELYKQMVGQLDAETKAYRKAVIEGQSALGELGEGIAEVPAAFAYSLETDPVKQRQMMAEAVKREQQRVQANAYLQDQERRAAEGENFFERSMGETGSFRTNVARGVGTMLPQLATQLAGRAAGAAAGARLAPGDARARTIGAAVGAVTGGGIPGAIQGRYDFVRRVMMDPNLTDTQKQEAIEAGELSATALGGALGAIPFGFRDVYRAAAPSIGQALGRGEAQQLARRALVEEANRSIAQNVARSFGWTGGELATMMGGGTALSNLLYGSATGQDIPLTEGLGESLGVAAALLPIMGVAGARPRMTRQQVSGWRANGEIKPIIESYNKQLRMQIENNNFGGRETLNVINQFKADWPDSAQFAELLRNIDAPRREVLSAMYDTQPRNRTIIQNDARARQMAAQGVAPDETQVTAKPQATREGRISEAVNAFSVRDTEPDAWTTIQRQSPTIADHVQKVSARLESLDANVRDFYDRLRKEPTSVKPTEIVHWLANQPDTPTMLRVRDELRSVLEDANKGRSGETKGRLYSYDKVDGLAPLIKVIKTFSGRKYNELEMLRVEAKRLFGWKGAVKEGAAEDVAATGEPTARAAESVVEQTVGEPEPTGTGTTDTTAPRTDSTMEAAAEILSEPVAATDGKQVIRSGDATEGGGTSRTETPDIRPGETAVSDIEQARVEPRGEGTDAGRSVEIPADAVPETSSRAGSPTDTDSGSTDGVIIKKGDSEKQPGAEISPAETLAAYRKGVDKLTASKVAKIMNAYIDKKYDAFDTDPNNYQRSAADGIDPDDVKDILKAVYNVDTRGKNASADDIMLAKAAKANDANINRMSFDENIQASVDAYRTANNLGNDNGEAFAEMMTWTVEEPVVNTRINEQLDPNTPIC